MDIRVDGSRSTSEDWFLASRASLSELPPVTREEALVAAKLGISEEDYQRGAYASDLSRRALEERADVVGHLVADWLSRNGLTGKVASVWLKTLEGKFRVDVTLNRGSHLLFINEELIDDLLDSGLREAQERLDRLLASNLCVTNGACSS